MTRRGAATPHRRRLRFEPLEDRRLLAVVTVDTLEDQDDGAGVNGTSLREAIALAMPGDMIDFSVAGTITLEHGQLLINKDLTISGPGAHRLTVDADGASRVFFVDDGNNGSLSAVTISGLTITGGVADGGLGDGGGILNREALTVIACHITGNEAEDGGGIGNFIGTFALIDSTVSNNSANGALGGGGGIFNFSANATDESLIRNSTISTNDASTTRGGGVYNFHGALTVEFSTITDNVALNGEGSGIATLGDVSEVSTLVRHSIVAGNVNSDIDLVVGFETAIFSGGYNVIGFGDATGPFVATGDQRFVSDAALMLGPLADNFGPTPTHALLPGSPAIDAGNPDAEPGQGIVPEFDQRGAPFGRVADGNGDSVARIDVGAYEVPVVFVVDTTDDEDDGIGVGAGTSLRDAILAANLVGAGLPIVLFDPALTANGPAVIQLTLGQLGITGSMYLAGPGASLLTIDALGMSRALSIDDGNNFDYGVVTVSGVTITGGNTSTGGAIYSQEQLTVVDSVVTGNTAQRGGGIYNARYGQLDVVRSRITGNHAVERVPAVGAGGGVYNAGGYARLFDTVIAENDSVSDGGGIRNNYGGLLLIQGSTVEANSAATTGGGIRNDGDLIIEDSTISGNEAFFGAGIFSQQFYLRLVRSTISGNSAIGSGGGISTHFGTAYVIDSTLHGNSASYGGGLYVGGNTSYNTRVANSTISGNTATVSGGGIYNFQGNVYLEFSTITQNSAPANRGGGVATWADPFTASTNVYGTIIAGNDGDDLYVSDVFLNTFYSSGYNLIGIGAGDDAFSEPGDQVGVTDPKLGPLADNGGPTMTHALLAGSPAIDAGDPSAVAGEGIVPLYDQRGAGFDRIRDGDAVENIVIDIGAFEVQQFVAGPELPGDYNLDGRVDGGDYVRWRNTLGDSVARFAGADGNGNELVDIGDYQVWKDNYGATLPMPGGGGLAIETRRLSSAPPAANMPNFVDDQPPASAGGAWQESAVGGAEFASPRSFAQTRKERPRAVRDTTSAHRATSVRSDEALVAWYASRYGSDREAFDLEAQVPSGQPADGDMADVDSAFAALAHDGPLLLAGA